MAVDNDYTTTRGPYELFQRTRFPNRLAKGNGLPTAEIEVPLGHRYQRLPDQRKSWYERFQTRNSGWRIGVLFGLCTSTIVLIGNFVLLFVGFRYRGYRSGIGILAQGRSSDIARLSTVYHALINVLSTLLLTSSNYCMQVLCSPNRHDIDRAHSEGSYLHIGILSIRNVYFLGGVRSVAWFVLMLSSIPLHLFYNSAISEVVIGHDYKANFISSTDTDWQPRGVTMTNLSTTEFFEIYGQRYIPDHGDLYLIYDAVAMRLDISESDNTSLLLSSTFIEGKFGLPVLLQPWTPINTNHFSEAHVPNFTKPGEQSINASSSTLPFLSSNNRTLIKQSGWVALDRVSVPPLHLQAISSVQLEDGSKVQVISPFMVVVILCNILKVAVMWWLWNRPHSEYFTTMGDAVQSFLIRPDRTTIGMCAESREALILAIAQEERRRSARMEVQSSSSKPTRTAHVPSISQMSDLELIEPTHTLVTFRERTTHWNRFLAMLGFDRKGVQFNPQNRTKLRDRPAAIWEIRKRRNYRIYGGNSMHGGRVDGYLCIIGASLMAAAIGSVVVFPSAVGNTALKWGTASSLRLDISTSALNTTGILFNTWLANAPQFGLSIVYITVNQYFTGLCSAHEWNRMAKARKTLRVTKPRGEQRSTHFLSLPYRWAVPLNVTSGFMHWLLSQTIFLTRLEMRDGMGNLKPNESLCTCGYSILSAIVLIVIIYALFFCTGIQSFMHIKEKLPLAANCSLVISAACHPPPSDVDAHIKPVQWGVVESRYGGTGHCSITSEEVAKPEVGTMYA